MNAPTRRLTPCSVDAPFGAASPQRVLKDNDTFTISDAYGDMEAGLRQGVFQGRLRVLADWRLRLNGERPLLLNSSVKPDNSLLLVDMTNREQPESGLGQGALHLFRTRFLWRRASYERLRITNYTDGPLALEIAFSYAVDFRDIFAATTDTDRIGDASFRAEIEDGSVRLHASHPLRVGSFARVSFSGMAGDLGPATAVFRVVLEPHEVRPLFVVTEFFSAAEPVCDPVDYEIAYQQQTADLLDREEKPYIASNNVDFDALMSRSAADLVTLSTGTSSASYPYSGIPWHDTALGPDAILTALQMLAFDPAIARGVLACLVPSEVVARRDASCGDGPLATRSSVDPGRTRGRHQPWSSEMIALFVWLASLYLERTGETAFLERLWPTLTDACSELDRRAGEDGFVWCEGPVPAGPVFGVSPDAMALAEWGLGDASPRASCETQAYVYAAKSSLASAALILGRDEQARALRAGADALKRRFADAFWQPDRRFYAATLDHRRGGAAASGLHVAAALFAGVAQEAGADSVACAVTADSFFSGWGVRSLAAGSLRYNPLSYHHGSVWPRDNALLAAGLARYGYRDAALRITEALFDVSRFTDLHRLPELFCGLPRHGDEPPTFHPLACSPSAGASAAPFLLLQACLGLSVCALGRPGVRFLYPRLPRFLTELRIEGLRLGDGRVDLVVRRHRDDVTVTVPFRRGEVEVVVVR